MTEELKYGRSGIHLNIGGIRQPDFLGNPLFEGTDPVSLVRNSLKSASPSLDSYIEPDSRVALVVSDQTRSTGSEIYIPILLEELRRLGAGRITIIIALGLHRPATDVEIQTICGGELPGGVNVINHDAINNLIIKGKASFNRVVTEAERVILTGAVTFHPMVGFSGGRKSLLPGIAGADDIFRNHRLYFSGKEVHPGTGPAMIDNNPVLDDIRERTDGFKQLWSLNAVLNEQNVLEFASAGDTDSVWSECCRYAASHHSIGIDEKYDLVIASAGGYPSDCSFYQSMKVLTNSSRACKAGGILIIFSQCSQGWEIRDELFNYFQLTLEEIAAELDRNFSMDGLALYMALKIIRTHKVWFFSDLPESEVRAAGMRPFPDMDFPAIEKIVRNVQILRTAVMPNGSSILPINTNSLRELL